MALEKTAQPEGFRVVQAWQHLPSNPSNLNDHKHHFHMQYSLHNKFWQERNVFTPTCLIHPEVELRMQPNKKGTCMACLTQDCKTVWSCSTCQKNAEKHAGTLYHICLECEPGFGPGLLPSRW